MAIGGGVAVLTVGAALLFVGLLASLVFERFRVPDVVLLLFAGILLGPVGGWIDAEAFRAPAEVFTTLALVVILFEGGLDLNLRHLRRALGLTTVLLLTSYLATAAALAWVGIALAGFSTGVAALFGLALAPLSSSILIPLVTRLRVQPVTRSVLVVESALGDVVAVLAVSVTASVLLGAGLDVDRLGRGLASSFLLGGVIAVVGGIAWLVVLRHLQGRPYAYLVTFAAALLLFGAVTAAGGNGVLAVLVFALVLGNASGVARRFPWVGAYALDDRIRWFHAEVSFFVRTFFFIYLGLLVTRDALGPRVLLSAAAALAAILLVRAALVSALVRRRPAERADAGYLVGLVPRGLASAALATLPAVVTLSAGTVFQDLAFALILATNLAMTAFILWKEGGPGSGAAVEDVLVDFTQLDLEGLANLPVNPETDA